MDAYQPNFKDPRVQSRIRHALGFSLGCMSTEKPHGWSTRYIDKHFGMQTNPLSQWLRQVLLVTTNNHYSMETGTCKQYQLNNYGVDYLRQVLKGEVKTTFDDYKASTPRVEENNNSNSYPSVIHLQNTAVFDKQVVDEFCKKEYGKELAELKFEYKDQSGRLWHPIQNLRREYKKELLAKHGLPFQYDIQCCAPTLIYEHARELKMEEYPRTLNEYLVNRTAIRAQLAEEAELPIKDVKILINALFCGARLGNNRDFALSHLLDHDRAKIDYIKQNDFIVGLREDIKKCWQVIEQVMPVTYFTDKNGVERKKPLSSKAKWGKYFDLERRVLNAVRLYLLETNNKFFLEHDGWTTAQEVNQEELIAYVLAKTGYRIKIDMEINK